MPDTMVVRSRAGGYMAVPVLDAPVAELRASLNHVAAQVAEAREHAPGSTDVAGRLDQLEAAVAELQAKVAALPPGLGRKS